MGSRKSLVKRLLLVGVLLFVIAPGLLLGGLWVAISNESFLTKTLLPYIVKNTGQRISVERAKVRPFSGVLVEGLRYNCEVETQGCPESEPFSYRIGSLTLEYNFRALFSRTLEVTSLRASDVWVGVSTISDGAAAKELPAPAERETPEGARSETPSFVVRISDTSLERGFFTLRGPGRSDLYTLEDISIRIPKANSNQDGEVSISARASAANEGLKIENQPLALRGLLRESTLFMPSTLDLDLSAGPGPDKALEVSGQLLFTREPYALTKVVIHKSKVRQSLLQLLGVPFEPLKEFQYHVQGHYSLGDVASSKLDLAMEKNTFVFGDQHNLKGTTLASTLLIQDDRIKVTDGSISVVDNGEVILSSKIDADVAFAPYAKRSEVKLHAALADFDKIRTLLETISGSSIQAPPDDAGSKAQKTPPSPQVDSAASSIRLPVGSLDIRIDKAIIQKLATSSFVASIRVPSPTAIEKAAIDATFAQGGTLSASASGSFEQQLSLKAKGKNVNMIPFANAARGPHGELLEGSIKSLDIDITADGKQIRKTLQGHATVSLSRLIVPSTLQEQVPFNILFMPLDALITVFGGTLNLMLPASISSISDSIRQTLDDAGRLGIDRSIIDLRFEKGKIVFKDVDFDTKNLPDFRFKGSITPDDKLDLTVFIALLKLNLPLPVMGTLSAPLPDVVFLGPELVRGLGLSLGSIAGSAASVFGGGSSDAEPSAVDPAAP